MFEIWPLCWPLIVSTQFLPHQIIPSFFFEACTWYLQGLVKKFYLLSCNFLGVNGSVLTIGMDNAQKGASWNL